jgi:hypothetical protein
VQDLRRGAKFFGPAAIQDDRSAMFSEANSQAVADSAVGSRDQDPASSQVEKVLRQGEKLSSEKDLLRNLALIAQKSSINFAHPGSTSVRMNR